MLIGYKSSLTDIDKQKSDGWDVKENGLFKVYPKESTILPLSKEYFSLMIKATCNHSESLF